MKVLAVCCLLLEIQTKEGTELFLAYFKDLHGWTNRSVLIDSHPFWENENAASSFSIRGQSLLAPTTVCAALLAATGNLTVSRFL